MTVTETEKMEKEKALGYRDKPRLDEEESDEESAVSEFDDEFDQDGDTEENFDEKESDEAEEHVLISLKDLKVQHDEEMRRQKDEVKRHHEVLGGKYPAIKKQYPAAHPGQLVVPEGGSGGGRPKVLCVFLGPSSDTAAKFKVTTGSWNPFVRHSSTDRSYVRTIKSLHNHMMKEFNFGLERFYLTDAFPLLYWNGKKSPVCGDYFDHFKYGVDHIKKVIEVTKPDYVLSFGRQAAFVVEKALKPNMKVMKSHLGTSGDYNHNYGKEAARPKGAPVVFYCHHPGSRAVDKFTFLNHALENIYEEKAK